MSKIIAIDPRTNKRLGELNNRGSNIFYDDEHIHELEGEHSFSFIMSSKNKKSRHFTDRGRFLIPSEERGFHEFIILESETADDEKIVTATAAYIEMDTAHIVVPGTYTGTLQKLASDQLMYTKYSLGTFQDIRTRTITIEEEIGVYQFLLKLATAFEVELRFRVELENSRFMGRLVDFIKAVGVDNGKEVVYGEDLISTSVKSYSDRITTKLLGYGPEREDGTRLTSEITDEDAFQRWNDQGQHIVRTYYPETSDQNMTQERLDQLTRTELKKRIDSVMEYIITAASIESTYPRQKVGLGDKLFIKNPTFDPPLYADARVIGIKRSIIDKRAKTYTIGEVVTYSEEEIYRTFRQLQRIYGVKLVKAETAPDGQPKTIWIDKGTPLNTPHTFNATSQEWEAFAPTSADQIGGVVVGQQYNGVTITPEDGLAVTRTDGLVRTVVNATEGIFIETRPIDTGTYQKVFYVDDNGMMTVVGIIRGSEIHLGGENNKDGILNVLNAAGELSSEMKAGYFGTEVARVGYMDAPNKLEYADFRGEELTFWVSPIAVNGNEPSDENSGTDGWNAPLKTITEAVSRIPKSFEGNVRIVLARDTTINDDIIVTGFIGNGRITINNDGGITTVNGQIVVQHNTTSVNLQRLKVNGTGSYTVLDLNSGMGSILSCEINGAVGGTTSGILIGAGGSFEIHDTAFFNVDYAVRATFGGNGYVLNCTGKANSYAFQSYGSGFIAGGGTAPTGTIGNGSELQGGLIRGSWSFPVPPTAPAPKAVETTTAWNARTDSGTYRHDENRWDIYGSYTDNVTQGTWSGYGPFTGSFFYGSAPSTAVTGKTIKRIRVQISRITGGNYAAQNVLLRPHTSTTRPSGNVSVQSPSHAAGIKVGETRWITLPSSFHAGFANGTYKGISINGSSYVKLSRTARIEITYE